jgi:hypothetical protein
MTLDVVTVAVLALVGTRLAVAARSAVRTTARQRTRLIVKGLEVRHFLPAPLVLVTVAVTATLLLRVPGLSFGWWTAIGGTGTVVLGGTDTTAGTSWAWLVPAAFLVLLVPALPLFAEREEMVFRLGCETWSRRRRAWNGVKFGLAHLIMGIPIAVALALSVGGWYFTWAYLRGWRRSGGRQGPALLESTRAHLAYNMTVVAVLVVGVVLVGALG